MINILSDSNGAILGVGEISGATPYSGAVPADFMNTFGLGKYTLVNGVITAVPGWVAPVITTPL